MIASHVVNDEGISVAQSTPQSGTMYGTVWNAGGGNAGATVVPSGSVSALGAPYSVVVAPPVYVASSRSAPVVSQSPPMFTSSGAQLIASQVPKGNMASVASAQDAATSPFGQRVVRAPISAPSVVAAPLPTPAANVSVDAGQPQVVYRDRIVDRVTYVDVPVYQSRYVTEVVSERRSSYVTETDTNFSYHDPAFGPSWRFHHPDNLDEKILQMPLGRDTRFVELRHSSYKRAVETHHHARMDSLNTDMRAPPTCRRVREPEVVSAVQYAPSTAPPTREPRVIEM